MTDSDSYPATSFADVLLNKIECEYFEYFALRNSKPEVRNIFSLLHVMLR